MATYTKYQCFVEDLAEGKHNLASNTITVALSNTAPNAGTHVKLADVTAVSTANLDDITPTVSSSSQTSGTYKLVLADLIMTASGTVGPFRYVILYNDTATDDPLICYFDYGSEVTLAKDDTFKLDFGTELFSLA